MFKRLFGSKSSTLVETAFQDVAGMLRQAARMMDLSLQVLLDNREPDVDLDQMDDRVDEGERMVRRTVLEHLSFNPQQDLVASLVLVSMVQDAERIGDYARSLGTVTDLTSKPRGGPWVEELRGFADRVRAMFELCERSFVADDPDEAAELIAHHLEIKSEINDFTRRVAASDLPADLAIVYAGAGRMLRRISAHMSNIASSVVQPYDRIRHGDEDA